MWNCLDCAKKHFWTSLSWTLCFSSAQTPQSSKTTTIMMMYSFFDLWQNASFENPLLKPENTKISIQAKTKAWKFHSQHTHSHTALIALFVVFVLYSYVNLVCDDQTMRHGVRMYTKSTVCAPIGVDLITKTLRLWWYLPMTALNYLSLSILFCSVLCRVCCSPNIFSGTQYHGLYSSRSVYCSDGFHTHKNSTIVYCLEPGDFCCRSATANTVRRFDS